MLNKCSKLPWQQNQSYSFYVLILFFPGLFSIHSTPFGQGWNHGNFAFWVCWASAKKRNQRLANAFLCECTIEIKGVLCQKSRGNPTCVGDRLYIEVEDAGYGPAPTIRMVPQDVLVGHVAKEKLKHCFPCSWSHPFLSAIGKFLNTWNRMEVDAQSKSHTASQLRHYRNS